MSQRDHPLLFRPEMVRALLAGTKTQTRRPAWREPRDPATLKIADSYQRITAAQRIMVGDLIWVRESWRGHRDYDGSPPRALPPTGYYVWFAADGAPSDARAGKLRSSIHMPRWASRLTLAVTDVRIERVQTITREGCIAEGMEGLEDVWAGWHQSYAELFNRIHGKGAWEANPEVVAITFTVHKMNVDAFLKARAA